jgi:hypothetical protein
MGFCVRQVRGLVPVVLALLWLLLLLVGLALLSLLLGGGLNKVVLGDLNNLTGVSSSSSKGC